MADQLPMGAKPVEVFVEGVDISYFFDARFLGLLSKRIPGVRVASIAFFHEVSDKDVHGEPKLRTIRLTFTERPKKDGRTPVSVDTEFPEDLQSTLSAMDEFRTTSK